MDKNICIAVFGISHKTAAVDIREKIALDWPEQEEVMNELIRHFDLRGCMTLSTCNRTEVYFSGDDISDKFTPMREWLDEYKGLNSFKDDNLVYTYEQDEAVRHLFKVMSGMESQILGEPQITGQVKDSYNFALKNNNTDACLNKLFNFGMQAQKKVRTNTFLTEGAVSVSSTGVELAKKIFNDLNGKEVLLVGAGKTAELAATHFLEKGVEKFHMVNRTLKTAKKLAAKFNGTAYALEEMESAMSSVNIVISATSSTEYVITDELMKSVSKNRHYRPIFLIDLAIPRDIDPGIDKYDGVYLYNLDDLNEIIRLNIEKRNKELPKATKIIEEYIAEFEEWHRNHSMGSIIARLKEKLESIRLNELEINAHKFKNNGFEEMDLLTKSLMNKIVKQHIISLKKSLPDQDHYDIHKKIITETFDLESD